MSDQRYAVTLTTKSGKVREEEFDDKPSAELHFGRLRALFPGATVSLSPIPLYRVEWRHRTTGETGHCYEVENSTFAWQFANRMNDLYPAKDHWVTELEAATP
jgi:hypothetical protein